MSIWGFFQNQLLGMEWLNNVIGLLLTKIGVDISSRWGGSLQFAAKLKNSGALLLGSIFALSFCPTSAVLYFGTLLPLAFKADSPMLLSGVFGTASALPVLCFAFILAFASRKLAAVCNAVTRYELWARRITGVIFLLLGIFFTVLHLVR